MSYDDLFGNKPKNRPAAPQQQPPPPWTGKPISDNTFTTEYIPTVFTTHPELNVGDVWYVKNPGATTLTEVEIIEATEKTVVLKGVRTKYEPSFRYEKTDIKFVEKVNENA